MRIIIIILLNLSYEYKWFFSATQLNKNDYELNWNLKLYYRIIHFTDFLFILILILSIDKTSFFLEPYEEKTSYTVLGGGFFFIYIYPDEPSIESLQLMFDPEEKEEIFRKWVFMIRSRIKLI